jgi:hypothetical protein
MQGIFSSANGTPLHDVRSLNVVAGRDVGDVVSRAREVYCNANPGAVESGMTCAAVLSCSRSVDPAINAIPRIKRGVQQCIDYSAPC